MAWHHPLLLGVVAPGVESTGLVDVQQRGAALAVGEREHSHWDPGDEILCDVEEALNIIRESCKKVCG
jgi:hypothetical protein